MANDVLPTTEDGRLAWGANMLLKFPPLAESVGFNNDEQRALLDDVTMMIYVITVSQSVQTEAKAQTAYKKQMFDGVPEGGNALPLPLNTLPAPPAVLVLPGVMPRIPSGIARMKTAPGFTDAIGEQLQIVAEQSRGLNLADAKPSFKALPKVLNVILDWVKGNFDGVVVEGKRGAETVFTLMDKDFKSPFEDMRPNLVAGQPEVRRYRMIYLLNDEIVGVYSDEVVITTMA